MRIGIDIDDTICRTTELVDKRMKEYAKKRKIDVLDVINHELEKENLELKKELELLKTSRAKKSNGKK